MPKIIPIILMVLIALSVIAVSAQDSTYTVEYGDVLDVIAAGFDVSVNCLAEQSGLDNPNDVRPGATLVISSACPPYDGLIPIERDPDAVADDQGGGSTAQSRNGYVVVRGDVLDLIAASFDVAVGCLAEANELADPGEIFIGDVITVDRSCPPYDGVAFVPNPRDSDDDGTQDRGGGTSASAASGDSYIVQRGEVIDLIAAKHNVEVACLVAANPQLDDALRIYPGDEITIDSSCPPYDGEALNT